MKSRLVIIESAGYIFWKIFYGAYIYTSIHTYIIQVLFSRDTNAVNYIANNLSNSHFVFALYLTHLWTYSKRTSKVIFGYPLQTYTVYSIYYTVYTIQYTVYTIQYRLYNIHYTLYSIHYTVYTIHYTVYTIHVYIRALRITVIRREYLLYEHRTCCKISF